MTPPTSSLPPSLHHRQPGRIRPRLEPLRAALETAGNPQHRFPSILITGSNGKGSAAVMLASILRRHGLATGLYTSPHLLAVEERIRLDGRPIDRSALDRHLGAFDAFPDLTFFEALTGAAFLAFAEAGLDCVVLEAGMGGRWDATRLAASPIAGLTNIGTDHRRWLGSNREDIARDKGAALAAADIAVLGPEVEPAIVPHLAADDALPASDMVAVTSLDEVRVRATWNERETLLTLPLTGRHQHANLHLALALAVAAARHGLVPWLEPDLVRSAVDGVQWPGRLSRHSIAGREVVVDCAHNLEACHALADHLRRHGDRPNLVFSCLDDKPVEAMAEALRPVVDRVAVCPLDDDRAMAIERMAAAFANATSTDDPLHALDALPDPVLVAGSIRLAGAVLEHAQEDPWNATP